MTREEIQKVIDEDINPGLAMHGGFISIHDFNEEHKIMMQGGKARWRGTVEGEVRRRPEGRDGDETRILWGNLF